MTYIVTSSTSSAPPYFEIYHDRASTSDSTNDGIPLNDITYNTAGLADALVASPTFSAHPLNTVAGDSIIVNNTIDSSRLAKKSTGLSGVTMNAYHPDDSWWIAPSSSHKYFFETRMLIGLPSTSDKIEVAEIGGARSDVGTYANYINKGRIFISDGSPVTMSSISNPSWPAGAYQEIYASCNFPAHSSYAISPHIDWFSASDGTSSLANYLFPDGCQFWNHHVASHSSYLGGRLKVFKRWAKLTQLA